MLFASAISRFYYSAYQLVMVIVAKVNKGSPRTLKAQNKIAGSHNITIYSLTEYLESRQMLHNKEIEELHQSLMNLKKARLEADYGNNRIIKEETCNFVDRTAQKVRIKLTNILKNL